MASSTQSRNHESGGGACATSVTEQPDSSVRITCTSFRQSIQAITKAILK